MSFNYWNLQNLSTSSRLSPVGKTANFDILAVIDHTYNIVIVLRGKSREIRLNNIIKPLIRRNLMARKGGHKTGEYMIA